MLRVCRMPAACLPRAWRGYAAYESRSAGSSGSSSKSMDDMLLLRDDGGEYPLLLELPSMERPPSSGSWLDVDAASMVASITVTCSVCVLRAAGTLEAWGTNAAVSCMWHPVWRMYVASMFHPVCHTYVACSLYVAWPAF